jgi:hypothetical protein
MANKNESGHTINLLNFDDMIPFFTDLGKSFYLMNDPKDILSLPAISANARVE